MKGFALLLLCLFSATAFSHVDGLSAPRSGRKETNPEKIDRLKEVKDHPHLFYFRTDWWQARLTAMEALDSSNLTKADRDSLKIIAEKDPEERIQKAAQLALDGKETVSMRLRREKKVLANFGNRDALKYRCDDPAEKRVEALANLKLPLSVNAMTELQEVRHGDPDPQVQEEAAKILTGGYPSNLKLPEDPKVLEAIGSHPDLKYDSTKPGKARADGLNDIRLDDVSILNEKVLERIAKEDPHPDVRRAANSWLQGYRARENEPDPQ